MMAPPSQSLLCSPSAQYFKVCVCVHVWLVCMCMCVSAYMYACVHAFLCILDVHTCVIGMPFVCVILDSNEGLKWYSSV